MDLAVVNLTGQQVYSQKVRIGQGRILNIDLAHLPVGAYFVTLDNGETMMSDKFILVD